MSQIPKAYGHWPSPISAELITRAAPGLNFVQSHEQCLYWVESRPWDAGRCVIMQCNEQDKITDLLPSPFSHHSGVHEYGGMAYTIHDAYLYFVNAADQRIYRQHLDTLGTPIAITPVGPWRFADLIVDAQHQRLIAVCEEHQEQQEAENYLATIALNNDRASIKKLQAGADFYAYPRLSPDQTRLCWIQWSHPNMPWDSSELCLASLSQTGISEPRVIAGSNGDEAIFQPHWSPDSDLYFVSDKTNWWNIYHFDGSENRPVLALDGEFATPLWQFGMATYDFINTDTIACLWTDKGLWHSGFIDITTAQLSPIISPYSSMHALACHQGRLYTVAGAATLPHELISIDQQAVVTSIYAPATLDVETTNLAQPKSIFFPSGNHQMVHAFFYHPTSASYCGQANELPPVIVMCHGGPTGATDSGLNLKLQYWTSRGFAVVDINYRGSTGFGRTYRQALRRAWGVADVEDTENAIHYLAQQQKIDAQRCLIRGGSAGGYTVLSALTFTDTFKAGASLYGIGDLETLATDTHKFESRYLDSLIGPYPEQKDIYIARSPIHHAEGLNCPVIFLQGLEDKVVPPNQAEMMVELLRSKGIKVAHVTFADEGHGFRKAKNIIQAMEAELAFYQQVFHLGADNNPN
ncbi:MAG: prolyl oligopeptidase family serine peptidase [Oceanospirillaceae bacterium]|nr:prolyl oligopeptidase family serine peptidase [Oceanospirillaceae bacterium]